MEFCNFCEAPIWTIFRWKLLNLAGWVAFHSVTFQLKCLDFQSNQFKKTHPSPLMFLQLLAIGQSKASTKREFNSVSTVQHLFMNYFIVSQGYSQKNIWWRSAACFPKPFSYLLPKSVIFPTLFNLWPDQKSNTLFKTVAADTATLNLSFEGFLIMALSKNDEKVASSK